MKSKDLSCGKKSLNFFKNWSKALDGLACPPVTEIVALKTGASIVVTKPEHCTCGRSIIALNNATRRAI